MDYSRPQLVDRLAAEYASGVLRGPARRRLEALLPAHPALRNAVRAWQDRLMPMTEVLDGEAPSPSVWRRIESRIRGDGVGSNASAADPLPWWRGLAVWRGLTAVAGIAAVTFAALLANPGPVRAPIIVVLSPTAPAAPVPGAAASAPPVATFVASITADGRALVTRPLVSLDIAPDKSLELWSLPPNGAPRPIGLIAADKPTVVERAKLLEGTDALAVSLEAAGGSPDGVPHGPVLYVGKLGL